MEALILQPTEDTPKVLFDITQNSFEISGRSLPENAIQFYVPLLQWFNNYANQAKDVSNFVFHFEYISTSSTKQVMKLFLAIDQLSKTKKVNVYWHYDAGDTDMLQTGERLEKLTSLKFIYKEV